MHPKVTFETVPVSIDLWITHPIFSKTVSSPYSKFALLLIAAYLSTIIITGIIHNRKPIIPAIALSLSILALTTIGKLTPLIRTARNPNSATIIAAMIDDKRVINHGPFKQYYFIVDSNRQKIGVITNKDIYNMEMYKKNSTFDYTVYTYSTGDKVIAYRFCRPEFKVKQERGNCQ